MPGSVSVSNSGSLLGCFSAAHDARAEHTAGAFCWFINCTRARHLLTATVARPKLVISANCFLMYALRLLARPYFYLYFTALVGLSEQLLMHEDDMLCLPCNKRMC